MTARHPLGATRWIATSDGRPLHTRIAGAGEPTVLFESGMGGSMAGWGAVAPAIARHARTVVYDRSGLGRSPSVDDGDARDLDRLTADLGDLVGALRADGCGPLVLVGHSWGGPILRTLAALRPGDVRAMVLVDPTDEGCDLYFANEGSRRERIMSAVYPLATRLGLMRPVLRRQAAQLPTDLRDEYVRLDGSADASRGLVAELASFTSDLTRLRDRPPDAPSCPVTIISGTRAGRADRTVRPALVAAHQRRAESLSGGRWVPAAGSGHMVMFTEPQIVVDEIVTLLGTD